jgi:hypothetical protein
MTASSTSRPLARCAAAEATTSATPSCQARCRRRASERESQISAIPKASARTRAAAGTPGGRTPWTIRKRSAISGVSADATPIAPTDAAAQASSDSGLGLPRFTRPGYNLYMSPEPRLLRWVPRLLALAAVALVPWTLWLTFRLPSRHVTDNYDVAWVGFDVALAAAFAATAWAAVRKPHWLMAFAAALGTMLVCDAWFDVMTSSGGGERMEALLEAFFAELPLAAICGYIVYDAERFLATVRRLRPATPAARRAALRAIADDVRAGRREAPARRDRPA